MQLRPENMKLIHYVAFVFALILPCQGVLAQAWTGTLERGGVVRIDPNTDKATVYTENGATQLWDGTHRLQDGSVIIVQDGVVTSGGGNLQTVLPPVATGPVEPKTSSACVELVIKVCGFNGECSEDQACSPARQLMQLEKEEAWQTRSEGPNKTSIQCREALQNDAYFSRCERHKPLADTPTACTKLVDRVCGTKDQCSEEPACEPARQLLAMETQERLASRYPNRPTYSSKKCVDAMDNQNFFRQCPADADNGSETPESETPPVPLQLPVYPHR